MKILNIRILKIQPLLNLVRGCIRAQALNGIVSSKFGGTLASLHGKSLHTCSPKGSVDLTVSANNSSSLDFNQQEKLEKLVQDENYKYWLGGFVEGEGALVISIVKNTKLTHKVALQPEFNVVQHTNGMEILHSFKILFGNKGTVTKKSGSDNVLVYSLKGTKNLKNYVLPFFAKYVAVYSSKYKSEIFDTFNYVINKLDENHRKATSKEDLIELIKLVYTYNPEGKGKQRKRTLEEILDYINDPNQ
uniref:LAGLIDADG endonuclease n=1 Tax=Cryphonectria parasitica TaxID=5116 RepID=A0A191MXB0_CRYPA|nr:LAGLIDADG endonuclease [Cryphonectria parasitica]